MIFGDYDIPINKDDITVMCEDNDLIGDILLRSRQKSGVTISDISRQTGISESTINRHLYNKTVPNLEMIVAYCIVLRINMFQSLYLIYKAGYNLFNTNERRAYFVVIVLSQYFGITIEQVNEILKCLDVEQIKYTKQVKEDVKSGEKRKASRKYRCDKS